MQALLEYVGTLEWQPIETAPKTVNKILVTDGFNETWVAFWYERYQQFCAYNCGDDYYSVRFYPNELTHWMPLPDSNAGPVIRELAGCLHAISAMGDEIESYAAKQSLAKAAALVRGTT